MSKIMLNDSKEIFWKYESALRFLNFKIESFKNNLESMGEDVPIADVTSRLKEFDSLRTKMLGDNLELTVENMENYMNDIAGIRIVCFFESDLKKIIDCVKSDEDIKVLKIKDFITTPKDSGYSSYHMIVSVPVRDYLNNEIIDVKAEIQIRTMAMDLWASLEHKVRYKSLFKISDARKKDIALASSLTKDLDNELNTMVEKLGRNGKRNTNYNLVGVNGVDKVIDERVMNPYVNAMNSLLASLARINNDFNIYYDENPIESIKYRLKDEDSIINKLIAKGVSVSEENIRDEISDVVGIRIICSFFCDVEKVIEKINKSSDICVIKVKDYITNPKPNGYSSYHMIVSVPVIENGEIRYVKAEIQVRTKAMNLWASLEHILCYKKKVTPKITENLKIWAKKINLLDVKYDMVVREGRSLAQLVYEDNDDDTKCVGSMPKRRVRS